MADKIAADDMITLPAGQVAPQGYVCVGQSASTCSAIFCRKGSVPHREDMSVVQFVEAQRRGGPCPV